MVLDTATLLTLAAGITFLLGILLLVLWLQERSIRALAWWGVAYLVGAAAVTLWRIENYHSLIVAELSNALLFVACGMVWTGARRFHGRGVLPGVLFAGAALWLSAMQFPALAQSAHSRVVLASLVIAFYAFLTAHELRRERRRELAQRSLALGIPILHGAVFLAPIVAILMVPENPSLDGLLALFALETLIYVVGTAFVVVVITKEQIALVHKNAAMTDPLTGLFNRRAFLEASNRLLAQRARKSLPVSVLLFDLDKFKSINDRFGHGVGDEALKLFAATASANTRATDVIGRLGGEEFAAILPSGGPEAVVVAERLRAAFQAAGVNIAGHEIGATVSIGVATALAPADIDGLLARADAALYRAKDNGRNRVERADDKLPAQGETETPEAAVASDPAVAVPG